MLGLCPDIAMVPANIAGSLSDSPGGSVGSPCTIAAAAAAAGFTGAGPTPGAVAVNAAGITAPAVGLGVRRDGGCGPTGRTPALFTAPGAGGRPASWNIIEVLMEPSIKPSTARLHFSTSMGCPTIVTRALSSAGVCWSTKQWAREKTLMALMVDACLPIKSPTVLCGISIWIWFFCPGGARPTGCGAGAGTGPAGIAPEPLPRPGPTLAPAPILEFPN
mmetsp:Transcript_57311/g.153484  ORF Transcript_57311/g.153484 Transcript_57311/m.153484 type:complete len:219 (+) Transcript_57311:2259-2915(+)